MDELAIDDAELTGPEAQLLIGLLNDELSRRYPEEGANHFQLDPAEVKRGRGAFVVARRARVPVGCGAVRLLEGGRAELKRMFTRPEERGRGVARALLAALERAALALGAERLVLETGVRQPEAIALYQRHGFTRTAPFGAYGSSPLSVCMEKRIA